MEIDSEMCTTKEHDKFDLLRNIIIISVYIISKEISCFIVSLWKNKLMYYYLFQLEIEKLINMSAWVQVRG